LKVNKPNEKEVKKIVVSKITKAFNLPLREVEGAIFMVDDVVMVNCTPHPLRFQEGGEVQGSVNLAKILSAKVITEKEQKYGPLVLQSVKYQGTEKGWKLCSLAEDLFALLKPRGVKGVLLVGSIISAQTYGWPVVSPVTTPETSRLPPTQRKVYLRRFSVWD